MLYYIYDNYQACRLEMVQRRSSSHCDFTDDADCVFHSIVANITPFQYKRKRCLPFKALQRYNCNS